MIRWPSVEVRWFEGSAVVTVSWNDLRWLNVPRLIRIVRALGSQDAPVGETLLNRAAPCLLCPAKIDLWTYGLGDPDMHTETCPWAQARIMVDR